MAICSPYDEKINNKKKTIGKHTDVIPLSLLLLIVFLNASRSTEYQRQKKAEGENKRKQQNKVS
jgi:hypothetical protein